MHLAGGDHLPDVLLHQLPRVNVLKCFHAVAAQSALEQPQLGVRALLQRAVSAVAAVDAHGRVALNLQGAVHAGVAAVGPWFAAAHLQILLVAIQLAGALRTPYVALDQREGRRSVFDTSALRNIGTQPVVAQPPRVPLLQGVAPSLVRHGGFVHFEGAVGVEHVPVLLLRTRQCRQLEIVTLLFVLLAYVSLLIRVVITAHRERVRRVDVEYHDRLHWQALLVPNAVALDAGACNQLSRLLPRRRSFFATCAAMTRAYLTLKVLQFISVGRQILLLTPQAVLEIVHALRVKVLVARSERALDSVLKGQDTKAYSALHLIALAQIAEEIIAGHTVDAQASHVKAAAARTAAHDELAYVVAHAAVPVIIVLHPNGGSLGCFRGRGGRCRLGFSWLRCVIPFLGEGRLCFCF